MQELVAFNLDRVGEGRKENMASYVRFDGDKVLEIKLLDRIFFKDYSNSD